MLRINFLICLCSIVLSEKSSKFCKPETNEVKCVHGTCQQIQNSSESDPSCVCEKGWSGPECSSCGGRASLDAREGVIIDGHHNYSLNTKCSWLIQGEEGVPIRLKFIEFATECSWDHLYIYDGDSVFSPLVAVFSGLLLTESLEHLKTMPEVSLASGSAFLHFYSDAAYNMSGFKIEYRIGSCPMNCSGHGVCNGDNTCTCVGDWMGEGCQIAMCPNNCNSQSCVAHGTPSQTRKRCDCAGTDYVGVDCSIASTDGHWAEVELSTLAEKPHGRASHKSVLVGDSIWVIGGYDFDVQPHLPRGKQDIARYDIRNKRWHKVEASSPPALRYGHSLATYGDTIVMYGGVIGNTITDELWQYNITSREWVPIALTFGKTEHPHIQWRAVVGHTAHIIDGIMYVIFGHSPIHGYLNTVQECNMSTFRFRILESNGAIVKGGYGHVSVYDQASGKILVHGGYHSGSLSEYYLADSLYAFEPRKRTWTILTGSGSAFHPQYLHSAVVMDAFMLVFAGNTHNDSSSSKGAKCYSAAFMAYDIECDKWYELDAPKVSIDTARFGHTAEVYVKQDTRQMYVFGGFNGEMMNDLLVYEPGNCRSHDSKSGCLAAHQGIKCAWVNNNQCVPRSDVVIRRGKRVAADPAPVIGECPLKRVTDRDKLICELIAKCPSCLSTSYSCEWCGDGKCRAKGDCGEHGKVTKIDKCYNDFASKSTRCSTLHNCESCHSDDSCSWSSSDKRCGDRSDKAKAGTRTCGPSCHVQHTCENCTASACMWCSNRQRCVEINAYVASFPYGQCMEWVTSSSRCPATRCGELRTCDACQENPACGWCDDGNNMGIGQCMLGGSSGPLLPNGSLSQAQCPSYRWHFADCPMCQCNGHSECHEDTPDCVLCRDDTTGPQCERCSDGYYGNPTNGRNCSACDCNGQADVCNHENGSCFCHTKGVTGDKCDECEENHKYYGDPEEGGTCFYELATDFQYTFNLSKAEDRFYRYINFMAMPTKPDRDVEFHINCSHGASMNITMRSNNGDKMVYTEKDCSMYKAKFSHKKFTFSRDANTTFYVYVYSFETPFWLVISFSQFPHIDLLQFFVTFFSCFLTLLAVAGIVWKFKQRYDRYRAIQRMKVEREQWANRPFAVQQVQFDNSTESLLEHKKHPPDIQLKSNKAKNKEKSQPSYIALEPMGGGRAGVVSVLFKLPAGDEDYTPPGVTGISIGTSLVLLGSSHKTVLDQPIKNEKVAIKSDTKSGTNNCPERIV